MTDVDTEDEGILDALDSFDVQIVTATGALETARSISTWVAAHGDAIDNGQKLHQLARARDLAALAATHLNDLVGQVADEDEDEDDDPDVVPCGHSVCANAYINGGEKECIEEPPEDDDEYDDEEAEDEETDEEEEDEPQEEYEEADEDEDS